MSDCIDDARKTHRATDRHTPVVIDNEGLRQRTPSGATGECGRIGRLWRGNRGATPGSSRGDERLAGLFDAFAARNVATERVIYAENAADEARMQLLGLYGVLVWVNPIQDVSIASSSMPCCGGFPRRASGYQRIRMSLPNWARRRSCFTPRRLVWGTDVDLYRSSAELQERFPTRLATHRWVVLKQARGTAGNGVCRVELLSQAGHRDATAVASAHSRVEIRQAQAPDALPEKTTLGAFLDRCDAYFAWSGSLIARSSALSSPSC
ncbi:MAG: hypothetical protein NVSMB2_08330 [Chloroflexota bacterium]